MNKLLKLFVLIFIFSSIQIANAGDHLVLTEICIDPLEGQFIEIYNSTDAAIDLTNYYVTDATDGNAGVYYYNIVTGENFGENKMYDFVAKFPAGDTIEADETKVISMKDGDTFYGIHGVYPDYELLGETTIPNMLEAAPNSIHDNPGFHSSRETVVLFYWDGQTDLVKDVDYFVYGGSSDKHKVDKTGVSLDGPDADDEPSTYLPDTPIASQIHYPNLHTTGFSFQRATDEEGENTNGNGITYHDETSENMTGNWTIEFEVSPGNYGDFPPIIYDISHLPTEPNDTTEVVVTASITSSSALTAIQLKYTVDAGAVQTVDMTSQGGEVYTTNIPAQANGAVVTYHIYAMAENGLDATSGNFTYTIISGGGDITPIADIQADPTQFEGQEVTIEGVITVGVGITNNIRTNAFVQDNSGKGIMLYAGSIVNETELVRGNLVRVVGSVEQYNAVTEITNFTVQVLATGQPQPTPIQITTGEANSAGGNYIYDGTLIQVSGTVTDFAQNIGGGSNIGVDDGTGEARFRVWNSTGIDLNSVSQGMELTLIGVGNEYNDAPQYLPAYQDHIILGGSGLTITNVTRDPLKPMENETVTVTAEISAPSGIDFAKLYYSVNQGEAEQVMMENQSGNIYSGTIDGQADGALIQYYIEAKDMDGNFKTSDDYSYTVGDTSSATPIADIQNNISEYDGQIVTIEGVVTVGVGILHTSQTKAYIQDNSGRGILLFNYDISHETELTRGNLVRITGTVEDYVTSTGETTEITDFTIELLATNQPIPAPLPITTEEANSAGGAFIYDGTLIQVTGTIVDYAGSVGGGTNIGIDDGTGETRFRIWDSADLDLSELSQGEEATLVGIGNYWDNRPQYLPAYQDHINPEVLKDPNITNFYQEPADSVMENEAVTIYATVTSDVGLDYVRLNYNLDFGSQQTLDMQSTENDVYMAEITGQSMGTIVRYYVEAKNQEGEVTQSKEKSYIVGAFEYFPIATIRENIDYFEGKEVTVQGIVTVGSGIIRNDMLSAYLQDESGAGINVFDYDLNPDFKRGNRVTATGELEIYNGVLEMVLADHTVEDTNQPLPEPEKLKIGALTTKMEGTFIEIEGKIEEMLEAGGGMNITLRDITNATTVRVWNTTGVNVDTLFVGQRYTVRGIASLYNNSPQLLLCYDEDIQKITAESVDKVGVDIQVYKANQLLFDENKPFAPDLGEYLVFNVRVPEDYRFDLEVYDLEGRLVKSILRNYPGGVEEIRWDGNDDNQEKLNIGMYLLLLDYRDADGDINKKTEIIVIGTPLK